MNKKLHPQTLAIRGGKEQTEYREHNQALFLTSSFMWESAQHAADLFSKKIKGFTYTRTANPTTAAFEKRIAALEGAERAVATSTGMSAIQAAFFTFLQAGDHVVSSRSLFGTTVGFINNIVTKFGIEVSHVSPVDVDEWKAAIKPNTKLFSWKLRPTHWAKLPIWKRWLNWRTASARFWWWTTASCRPSVRSL